MLLENETYQELEFEIAENYVTFTKCYVCDRNCFFVNSNPIFSSNIYNFLFCRMQFKTGETGRGGDSELFPK